MFTVYMSQIQMVQKIKELPFYTYISRDCIKAKGIICTLYPVLLFEEVYSILEFWDGRVLWSNYDPENKLYLQQLTKAYYEKHANKEIQIEVHLEE